MNALRMLVFACLLNGCAIEFNEPLSEIQLPESTRVTRIYLDPESRIEGSRRSKEDNRQAFTEAVTQASQGSLRFMADAREADFQLRYETIFRQREECWQLFLTVGLIPCVAPAKVGFELKLEESTPESTHHWTTEIVTTRTQYLHLALIPVGLARGLYQKLSGSDPADAIAVFAPSIAARLLSLASARQAADGIVPEGFTVRRSSLGFELSDNEGKTWRKVLIRPEQQPHLAYQLVAHDRYVFALDSGLLVSRDAGESWSPLSPCGGPFASQRSPLDPVFRVGPHLFMETFCGVFRVEPDGQLKKLQVDGREIEVERIRRHKARLYGHIKEGVVYSDDSGLTWTSIRIPGDRIFKFEILHGGRLMADTPGGLVTAPSAEGPWVPVAYDRSGLDEQAGRCVTSYDQHFTLGQGIIHFELCGDKERRHLATLDDGLTWRILSRDQIKALAGTPEARSRGRASEELDAASGPVARISKRLIRSMNASHPQ